MHVGTSLLITVLALHSTLAFPTSESTRVAENAADKSVGRLAFTLADPSADKSADAPPGGTFMEILSALTKSSFFQKFIQYIGGVAAPQKDEPKKAFATRPPIPQADIEVARNFEASLSHDDAIESVPSGAAIAPMTAGGPPKSIKDEGFTQLLFGEKGVLTNVFHVMDAQRQNDQATMAEAARRSQADPSNGKINKDMDFAKVFDALLMGGQKKNEFGEPGPELPEFLGICNRLSCGDIYKAIDEFRRSDFFSNFQTALQLVQDPKGWEILGKMLSNPELIAQFTGGGGEAAAIGGGAGAGIGAGLSGMLGSALGGAKAAVAKEGGDTLTSKDGDFGTDFSAVAKIDKDKDPAFVMPETSFSIDEGAKGAGAGEDYYSEIVTNIDEDFEVEDRDILGLPTRAPTSTTKEKPSTMTTSTSTTGRPSSTTVSEKPPSTSMRSTSPSTTSTSTSTSRSAASSSLSTTVRPATAAATRSTTRAAATLRPTTTQSTTRAAAPSTSPVMVLPKKGDLIPLPDFEFNIDEEDYGSTFEKSVDAMPPVDEKIVVDEKIPASTNITAKPVEMLVVGRNFMETSKIMPSSTRQTTVAKTTVSPPTVTTPRPRPIVPIVVPRAIKPVPVPVITPAPLVIAPSTSRPKMRRISISGSPGSTQAPKNFRKESDYYSMYYDN